MVISRDIIRETPFRALITLLTTYLLSPLPLQVELYPPYCNWAFSVTRGNKGINFYFIMVPLRKQY